MAIRNCAEIGNNLQLIVKRLFANQNLLKYLYYTDKDPLNNPDLSEEQIQKEIFEKLIKIVPRVGAKETAQSIITIRVVNGLNNGENEEFRNVTIAIEVFVPMTQWLMKGDNLRPFAIMGEVQKSLNNKTINGLGKMQGGSFELNFLTEEISDYEQTFRLITYD